jgi:tetratricopeptide (TPR) repeat protein
MNWVGPLLAKGATVSMGSVDEPYLTGTPDVGVFVARFTFSGFSFGEAAYAAQGSLSWQTTVVGDPLYRPYARTPQQIHEALERNHSKFVEWAFLLLANINLAKGMPSGTIAGLLESLDTTKHSAVLMEKLGDLYSAQGKPTSSADAYASALKLEPSPQQKVRLRLVLAEKLTALDRDAEASDDLAKLLDEDSDYPDKLAIYRKLLLLAHKLHRQDDIAKYDAIILQLTPPPPPPAAK